MDPLWSKQWKARTCSGFLQQDSFPTPSWKRRSTPNPQHPTHAEHLASPTFHISMMRSAVISGAGSDNIKYYFIGLTHSMLIFSLCGFSIMSANLRELIIGMWTNTHTRTHIFRLPDRSSSFCEIYVFQQQDQIPQELMVPPWNKAHSFLQLLYLGRFGQI